MATAATSTPTAATAPLTLPKEIMEVVAPTETFPTFRKKWLSNEEVVSLLISYNKHSDWLTTSIKERPPNGTVMLVNRKAVKYKKDGYCWKVRKDSTIIREDTMRLKIQCLEVLKCLYAHSSLVPTFHRRSYWLFINPDIVLVHYLNVNPEYTYSSLMGNPPPLFTLPNYWPSVRPWNKKELLSELSPMYEQCTNEDGTLPGGMKNMEDLISLIMEARKTAATTEESATGMPVKSNSNQSCKLTQCQKKDAGVLTGSKTNRGKNLDGGAVCEKYRPILASTGHNSKTMPLVLNIQPVLAVVQTKMAVSSLESAAATASTSESSTSEDRMIKSVSETSTQTCEDFVNDHSNEDSILLDCQTKKSNGCSSNPVSCCLSSSSSGSLAVDTAGCRITGRSNSTDISVVLRRSPSRVFARSSAFDELVTKASDYNFASFTTNQSRNSSSTEPSYSSPVQEAAVRSSIGCSVGATLLSPNSVFDSTAGGSPLESLSSCEHSFNPSQPPQSTLRSRSIGSDLGFSESIDCFSPSLYFNNPSSVSTLMYDIASPSCSSSPLATGNKMQCQDATRGNVVTTAPRNDLPPTYDLSCYHCDSFSSCGPASSLSGGGINSSGSSNSVLTEHTNRSEAIPPVPTRTISNGGDEAPSFTESVLDSLETPYTREATQGTVSTNCSSADSYIPNFSSSDTIQGFSEMTTHHLSHAGLINDVTAAQNEEEVFSSATELPDLSSMADFNEQMCRLAPHAVSSSPTEFGTNGRGGVGVGDASHGFASLQQQQRSSLSVPTITHMLTFVTEYSPNWCYEEGGEKVLVAGNWLDLNSTDSFQCQFGDKVVPAALILPGVLRCLSPDFSQGVVPLSVLRNGTFLTHSVPFEYRLRLSLNDMNRSPFDVNSSSDYDWLALDDRQFRYRLLTRLNQMHNHLTRLVGNQFVTNQTSGTNSNNSNAPSADLFPSTECLSNFEMEFERKFVAILQIISQVQQACVGQPIVELPRPPRGLTMLHLAAALGMPRLIDMMRSSVSQLGSMCDLNPASLDDQHCSPLTWACARGNLECTLILHNWCHEMLHARNRLGLTPAMIAKQRGHILLVETLTEQVTGNSRNYKSTRGKRPCPININERGRQGPEGKQNATIPFNFVPMQPPDAMSSCSEYDSEDNCSLSSNALGEFGGMTLSEIEQLAFNEGFGNLGQSGVGSFHAQGSSPLHANTGMGGGNGPHFGESRSGDGGCGGSSVGYGFRTQGDATDDLNESDSEMDDLSRSCSPYITTSLQRTETPQVYNLAQQIIRAIPERIKRSDCQESQEVRDEFEFGGGAGVGQRHRSAGGSHECGGRTWQNCSCGRGEQFCSTFSQNAAHQHNPAYPTHCCSFSRGTPGRATSLSICSSFDLLSDELENDQMSECGGVGGGGAYGLSPDPSSNWSSGGAFRGAGHGETQGVHHNGDFDAPMEDLKEFIQGRGNVEAELNSLTLTDRDQRTLYESAKIIQSAFRQYKQCREKRRQEIAAAILIQSYFRKYKQYFSYKRMCRAARLIQKVFRRYKYSSSDNRDAGIETGSAAAAALRVSALAELNNDKLFQQQNSSSAAAAANSFIGYLSRHDVDQAVLLVQRNYRRRAKRRRENDAALKIQRFLRQCKNKIQTLRYNGAGDSPQMMWSFAP